MRRIWRNTLLFEQCSRDAFQREHDRQCHRGINQHSFGRRRAQVHRLRCFALPLLIRCPLTGSSAQAGALQPATVSPCRARTRCFPRRFPGIADRWAPPDSWIVNLSPANRRKSQPADPRPCFPPVPEHHKAPKLGSAEEWRRKFHHRKALVRYPPLTDPGAAPPDFGHHPPHHQVRQLPLL